MRIENPRPSRLRRISASSWSASPREPRSSWTSGSRRCSEGVLVTGTARRRSPVSARAAWTRSHRDRGRVPGALRLQPATRCRAETPTDEDDGYRLDGDCSISSRSYGTRWCSHCRCRRCAGRLPGLCVRCGVRLADAGAGHGHDAVDRRGGRTYQCTGGIPWTADKEGGLTWPYPSGRCRAATPGPVAPSGRPRRHARELPAVPRPKLPHTACPTCGTYNRRQVIDPS